MGHHERLGKTDEWYTPKYIFDALGCTFDLDVAHPKEHKYTSVPAKRFLYENSLDIQWVGYVWMNPPFGGRNNKEMWLDKIFAHGNGLALTPDRTSAPWWQKAAKQADAILFVDGKIKFIQEDGTIPPHPGNGTTLFAYGSKAVEDLLNAQKNGLGIVFKTVKP